MDIGNCRLKGSTEYSVEDQTYTLSGAGTNMWFGQDDFQYLRTTIQGDFILRAEVKFIGEGGHLYNYELASHTITPLNKGLAVNNNNNHVLTFDRKLLGISNHNQEDDGTSAIYYVPTQGDSLPEMVTEPGVSALPIFTDGPRTIKRSYLPEIGTVPIT